MTIQENTLKNGLRVLFVETGSPSLTTILLIGAGSRYETEKNNGIAHFFEHMAFKGSKKYPSAFIISSLIEGMGANFNAFTSKDHTGYWIKSTPDNFEKVVDVLSDMVLNPLLLEEEIEREKGVIVEEINMYEDTPQRKVGELFENLLYKGNPLGFDIAGTKETVLSFKRSDFIDYMENLYYPENAVLVVAGGFSEARRRVFSSTSPPLSGESPKSLTQKQASSLLSIIEKKFSQWKNKKAKLRFEKVKENQSKPQILVKTKKTEQAHFCLGYRAFSFNDERRYTLTVLSAILGGGMSSRLFMEVREKRGLCYYISTGRELYYDVGNIVTQAGVAIDLKKVKEAIKVILNEHEKIKEQLSEEELEKTKQMLKGRFLLALESSNYVASLFGTDKLLKNKIQTVEEIIKNIEKVSVNDVKKLAKELFIPSKLNFAIIGPFKNEDFKDIFI